MTTRLTFCLALLGLLLAYSNCFSQNSTVLYLAPNVQQVSVKKPFLSQFTDLNQLRSLSLIRRFPADKWTAVNSINFGSQGSPGWATFQLQSPVRQTLWLEIDSHFIDSLQIWLIREPGLPSESITTYQPVGFQSLLNDRETPVQHRYIIKQLHLLSGIRYAVYIRGWVPPADVLKFGVTLWHPSVFGQYQQIDIAGWAVFAGLVLMSVFITTVSYAFNPRRIYLYYIGYISCMSVYALLNDGWGMLLPIPLRWFDSTSTAVHWLSFGILFLMLFTRSFLAVNAPTAHWWLRLNPIWLTLTVETAIFLAHYGVHYNHFDLVWFSYQVGFSILAIYAILWLSYIANAINRHFRPVWLYITSALVWLFFYVTNVFVVNTGLLTEPFPDMLVFRLALLAEVCVIFIGWMYRQRIIRKSEQRLQRQQQARQHELFETERKRQAEELKALRLQNELQQQRERLARDLHDGIGSQLTHIVGRLDILSVRKTDEQPQLERLSHFARETNQALRDTVWILNRSEIPLSTFAQRLHSYLLRLWEDIDTTRLDWHTDPAIADPVLSPLVVQCLFRITQEAVNNALKYAGATSIRVNLIYQDPIIALTVADNGNGFDVTTATNGYGLTNMQKRAEEIGGQWALISDNTGTQIQVSMNITN